MMDIREICAAGQMSRYFFALQVAHATWTCEILCLQSLISRDNPTRFVPSRHRRKTLKFFVRPECVVVGAILLGQEGVGLCPGPKQGTYVSNQNTIVR